MTGKAFRMDMSQQYEKIIITTNSITINESNFLMNFAAKMQKPQNACIGGK